MTKKERKNLLNKDIKELTKLENQLERLEKSYLLVLKAMEDKAAGKTKEQEGKIAKIHSEISKIKQEDLKTKEILKGFQKTRLDLNLLSKEI